MQRKWLLITPLSLLLSMKVLSSQLTLCPNDLYKLDCGNGECFEKASRCDGEPDCGNRADEMNCDKCSRPDCSHGCRVKSGHEHCVCEPGFYLDENERTCHDIDECSINGWCSQKCVNSIGSFECSCKKGYELQANNRTCMVPPDVEPLLLYAQGDCIKGMYLKHTGNGTRHNISRHFDVVHDVHHVGWISVDPKNQKVFWIERNVSSAAIISADMNGGHNSSHEVVVFVGLVSPLAVDYDWIANNIYIIDASLEKIIVCKADGSVCSVLNDEAGELRRLAIDPANGYIYWATLDDIWRSGMDGSNVTMIAEVNELHGFTLDRSTSRLYWADDYSAPLEYYDIESGKRGTMIQSFLSYIPGYLTVFEDNFFWSDPKIMTKIGSISTCVKFSGRNNTVITAEDGKSMISLHIYHPSLYDDSIANPCEGEPCSHMCLFAPGNSYKCACPYQMTLSEDLKTCIAINTTFVLVSQKHSMYKFYPESIGRDVVEEVQLPRNFTITNFSFDPDSNTMYIFECEERCSIIQCDLTRQNCESIAQPPTKTVRGLTFDRMSKNLLWVDSVLGHLAVFSTVTRTWRTLIDKGLERPVDLAINYRDRVIYIANLGSEPSILQVNMDGTQQRKVINGSYVGLPVSLAYSAAEDRLYWVDAVTNRMNSTHPSSNHLIFDGRYFPRKNKTMLSFRLVSNAYLYTDKDTPNVYRDDFRQGVQSWYSIAPQREKSVKIIQVVEMNFDAVNECSEENGGCSHICLPTQSGRICTCSSTHSVDPHNHTNCLPCEANELQCLDGVNCYHKLFACDGHEDCPDGSDESNCSL